MGASVLVRTQARDGGDMNRRRNPELSEEAPRRG
jgi:hypothetical protein